MIFFEDEVTNTASNFDLMVPILLYGITFVRETGVKKGEIDRV